MESERFQRALGRLEAAVERLEKCPSAAASGDDRLAALEGRYTRLRTGTEAALARLDRLIGGDAG